GRLDMPVVNVAKSGWNRDQLVERAKASVTEYGGLDPEVFPRVGERLRYVDGDYADLDTFTRVRQEIKDATRPLHYLAIPPSLFPVVVENLKKAGCTAHARVG